MERVNLRLINHNIQQIQTSEDDSPLIGCCWKAVQCHPIFLQGTTQALWPDIYATDYTDCGDDKDQCDARDANGKKTNNGKSGTSGNIEQEKRFVIQGPLAAWRKYHIKKLNIQDIVIVIVIGLPYKRINQSRQGKNPSLTVPSKITWTRKKGK